MALAEDLLRNRLLVAAPAEVREQIVALGALEPMEFKRTVFEPDRRIEHVVFPLTGVCSLLSVGAADGTVEVATIGNEGFVGLPVFLQATLMSAHRAVIQIPGEAIVVGAPEFLEI